MAAVARSLPRLARPARASLNSLSSSTFKSAQLPLRSAFRHQSRRGYASGPGASSGSKYAIWGIGGLLAVGAGYAGYQYSSTPAKHESSEKTHDPKLQEYQNVYNAIAAHLHEHDDYDDGSYGPVLVRLGWHASGTYDAETKTGGSNGATMRFAPEGDHGANAGLKAARDFLEPVKEKFPWITYSDLWTLAAVCSIQEMHGPIVPWRPGRADRDVSWCTPDGRLPDGAKEHDHLRAIFGRMGFNDQEIVALSGAHALGRCHTDRSGFEGPWTFSPTVVTNDYFKLLVEEKWNNRKWNGPKQYQDISTKSLMMLPTDMALIKDKVFRPYVEKYAKSGEEFFTDFSKVLCKLFELGVPFQEGNETRFQFQKTE